MTSHVNNELRDLRNSFDTNLPILNLPIFNPHVNLPVLNPHVNLPVLNPHVNLPILNPHVNLPVLWSTPWSRLLHHFFFFLTIEKPVN